jgi:hypothetical protein
MPDDAEDLLPSLLGVAKEAVVTPAVDVPFDDDGRGGLAR